MSEQKKPSETALGTAFIRALSCFEPDPSICGRDDLAILFLPNAQQQRLQNDRYRDKAKSRIGKGTYEYVIARTKYIDTLFAEALNNNIEQIVILGAGYDARAYRFKDEMKEIPIFEVDALFTQAAKIEKLVRAEIPHKHVRFVTVDFEKDDLESQLSASGFRKDAATLFIWEGVSLYLTPESVDSTLNHIRSLCCGGSLLCFDYFNSRDHHLRRIEKKDELILFGMNSKEMSDYLGSKGFSVVEDVNPDELHRCYLTCSDGSSFGDHLNKMNIVRSVRDPAKPGV